MMTMESALIILQEAATTPGVARLAAALAVASANHARMSAACRVLGMSYRVTVVGEPERRITPLEWSGARAEAAAYYADCRDMDGRTDALYTALAMRRTIASHARMREARRVG